jgi:prepilin-type N-terminal cleavage/methylation domain-containing protein
LKISLPFGNYEGQEAMSRVRNGFTLVEILIVVVILGILAAIVVPLMAGATTDAAIATAQTELNKVRRAVEVFKVSNDNNLPTVVAGDGTWGEIVSRSYLQDAPTNQYVGGANSRVIAFGNGPDAAFQTTHGWIYDTTTGDVWAGGFDSKDQPLPRP